ncbi:type II toxin-antitoxin system RelE/ParE family toxin [Sphingopyxis macrogoltabida]|uniref:Type II toxin-antitoxin system RelE/ParE family toxin n=1 Tax=Sphingopyxis macrogoltabida TaxID=33050 RepID=A0A0N9UE96_SPHMC|nr:type II toxin-antitoxin system RelE/ParE family toxin [Sphingopyxis macrogoltabida]ALH82032.1 hypothetical protein AN936_17220 [Sphingopyxis macrogoltabida]
MRLRWTPHARADLFRLADFLNEGEPGTGDALLHAMTPVTEQLLAHPRIGPAIGGARIRKWPIAGTPGIFLYMVRDDEILLLRLVPNRSDWQSLL